MCINYLGKNSIALVAYRERNMWWFRNEKESNLSVYIFITFPLFVFVNLKPLKKWKDSIYYSNRKYKIPKNKRKK